MKIEYVDLDALKQIYVGRYFVSSRVVGDQLSLTLDDDQTNQTAVFELDVEEAAALLNVIAEFLVRKG